MAIHDSAVERLVLRKSLRRSEGLYGRWPLMKVFHDGDCLRWSGVVKEEHPARNLEHGKRAYRELISNMHCFSEQLILSLLHPSDTLY